MAGKTTPIFDTSIFSDYAKRVDEFILSILFPTVVFYELVAPSIDDAVLQQYERWRISLSRNNRMLNPKARDWWETSKAIRRLYLMKVAQPTKLKTLRNDALIARLAVTHDGFVVTHDVDDFQIIQRVMPGLKVMSAKEFFEN